MPPQEFLPSLSIVVLGQMASGKSTVVGHLRYLCGCVPQNDMNKLAQQAAAMGKASSKFAWVSDKFTTERERGATSRGHHLDIRTSKHDVWLVDTPGNAANINHTIQGAASADHAVLVVDACDGSYEVGMAEDGATKEHALIAFAMGAKQLIVVVNKMDALATPYAQERFDQITSEVGAYLAKLGFKDADIQYIPVSGYVGENLVTKSTLMPWYSGVTLLEALDSLTPPTRAVDKPFRMPVEAAHYIRPVGVVVTGYVQTGVLKCGMQLSFGPDLPKATVIGIEAGHQTLTEATPGMAVGVNVQGITCEEVRLGSVASDASWDESRTASSFTAQLVFVKDPSTYCLTTGYSPVVHCHTAHVACRIRAITAKLSRLTGEVIERPTSVEEPLVVLAGEACLAVLEPTRRMVVEAFREYPSLGRIVVRDTGGTVAVGIIKSVAKNRAEWS